MGWDITHLLQIRGIINFKNLSTCSIKVTSGKQNIEMQNLNVLHWSRHKNYTSNLKEACARQQMKSKPLISLNSTFILQELTNTFRNMFNQLTH